HGYDAAKLEHLVTHESGLLALSETTGDMRALLAARERDPRAAFAVDVYCWHVRKAIGALATTIGGIGTLVFTGGIGEHAPFVRPEIARGLEHLGVRVDPEANAANAPVISTSDAACTVRVVPADEERMIARHAIDVARGGP